MKRKLPSMTSLLAFEASAVHLSFTKAGEQLGMTQSAVSKQVQMLEDFLGKRVFDRKGRAIALTVFGEQLMRELPEWLNTGERLYGKRYAEGIPAGPLRIAVLPTFGTHWLAPRLGDFLRRYPRVELSLKGRVVPFDFNSTDLDAAIHYGQADWPLTKADRLFGETTVAVASPTIASKIEVAQHVRRYRPILQTTRPHAWTDFLTGIGEKEEYASVELPPLNVEHFSMLVMAVQSSVGIGLVPERWVEKELAEGSVVRILNYRYVEPNAYYLVMPAGRLASPALLAFKQWILQIKESSVDVQA